MGVLGFLLVFIGSVLSPTLVYFVVRAPDSDFAHPDPTRAKSALARVGCLWMLVQGLFCVAALALHFSAQHTPGSGQDVVTANMLYVVLGASTIATIMVGIDSAVKVAEPRDRFQPIEMD